MKTVKIISESIVPNKRTKIMIGRRDYMRDIDSLVFIMQKGEKNKLIIVTNPEEFDLKAEIEKELPDPTGETAAGAISKVFKKWFDKDGKDGQQR